MSLRVWLPLNGDLRNLGCSGDIIFTTNTGATINNNGKIGKCYSFDGNDDWVQATFDKTKFSGKPISLCMWFKCDKVKTGAQVIDLAADLILGYTYDSNGIKFGTWRCYSASGTRAGISSYSNIYYNADNWHHCVAVIEAGKETIYVDGQLSQTFNHTDRYTNYWEPLLDSSYNKLSIGKSTGTPRTTGSNYWIGGLVNDIRIYDHALSAAEVAEIARGLVLHYKLDTPFLEETTNLCTSGTLSNSCYNGATGKYGHGTNTDIYKTQGIFQNKYCTKIYMGTAGQSAYPYVFFDYLHPLENQYKTLSFDYFPTSQDRLIFYTYNGGATASYTINGSSTTTGSSIPVILNKWNHITLTLLGTSSATNGWGYVKIGTAAHTSTITDYWLFANIQIEEKDHATPYTPNSRAAINYIPDSSGYGHNGKITGTITLSSESPRYNASSTFNGTERITTETLGADIRTLSCWCKTTKNKSTSQHMIADSFSQMSISFYNGTIIGVFGTTRGVGSKCTLGSSYKENEWNHIVVVKTDDAGARDIYCNGIKLTPTSNDYWGAATGFFVGARNTSNGNAFYGQISDVRAYVTPLLDTDIKSLYNLGMKIDNLSTLHTYELEETNTDKLIKTGVLKSQGLYENGYANILHYDKNIYVEPDGSTWAHICHHNNPANGVFSSNGSWATGYYIDADRWYDVEQILSNLIEYEFMVKQKTTSSAAETKYRWIQSINPMNATWTDVKPGTITYITTSGYTNGNMGGMYYRNGGSQRMCIANDSNGNWYGGIGVWAAYQSGIPGYPNTVVTSGYVDLYARVYVPTKLIKDKGFSSIQFIEA